MAETKKAAAKTEPAPPPFYEATDFLTVGNPEAGVAAARAFAPGDRVPPDLVEPNGWGGKVKVPAQFRGTLPPPPPGPAAAGSPS